MGYSIQGNYDASIALVLPCRKILESKDRIINAAQGLLKVKYMEYLVCKIHYWAAHFHLM